MIGIMATEATIWSKAYEKAIHRRRRYRHDGFDVGRIRRRRLGHAAGILQIRKRQVRHAAGRGGYFALVLQPPPITPALLTRTSSRPNCSSTEAMERSMRWAGAPRAM